ncbi:gamma carbonic anhydrase family protein [Reichenbachiella sp. MALMAid0571]|uniref:gamma carbonic anhydrase family protein n=1 Tax=Reichenbachiella sp. MALMAid0571 TaxID=3143939 RepID=UPI0032DEED5C
MSVIREINGKKPVFGENCWYSETSVIVGDVEMGNNCTIWYNAIVRGDVNFIKIGENTNIQDGAVIHCTYLKAGTTIGSNVSIGHNAIVHGCTIEDNVLIGMGAIVMDHAVVKSGSIIGAGAIVLQNQVIEPNSIYVGNPAKKVKEIGENGVGLIERTANNYIKYAGWFKE